MSIDWKAGVSLAEYIKLRNSGKLEAAERPKRCLACQERGCFWAHGSYSRHLEEGNVSADIAIPRWKFRYCGKTDSSPPPFAVPRCRYTIKVIGAGLDGYAARFTSYRSEVVKLGESGPSPSQLFQWVKEVARKASGLLVEVQGMCLTAGDDVAGLLRGEAASCPNSYKAAVVGKAEELDTLAKLRSFAGVLFQGGVNFVFWCLSLQFLRNADRHIFLSQEGQSPTPQRTEPRNSEVF